MSPRSRWSKALVAIALLALVAAARPAAARDHEFGLLVHQIESQYHARRQHRFLIGFASGFGNFVITFWRPFGVRNVKLALFSEQDLAAGGNSRDFQAVVQAGLNQGWRPLVQVWSRRDGERTYVFARDGGKYVKFLVATVEQDEAAVVQVQVNPDKLSRSIERWTDGPHHDCDHHCPRHDRDDVPSDAFTAVLAQARSERPASMAGR
jgi:hypothetical protein